MINLAIGKRYPILRRIVFLQVLILLIGMSLMYVGINLVIETGQEERLKKQKEYLVHHLTPFEEKWRSWHELGLHEELQADMEAFKSLHRVDELRIVNSSTGTSLGPNSFSLPQNPDGLTDSVVFSRFHLGDEAVYETLGSNLFWIFILFSIFFLGVGLVSAFYIRVKIYKPLKKLNDAFENAGTGEKLDFSEIQSSGEISAFIKRMQTLYNQKLENDRMAAIGKVGRQVSHDIKSPLVALKLFVKDLVELPEEKRRLIRFGVRRIESIVYDLEKLRISQPQQMDQLNDQRVETGPVSIFNALSLLLWEKKSEFKSRPDVQIELQVPEEHRHIFVLADSYGFRRVISNLLNNAVESVEGEGQVRIFTSISPSSEVLIHVEDTGRGIPPSVLEKVWNQDYSYQKPEGSGLGLSYAKKNVEGWGGHCFIRSTKGKGTTVTVALPTCEAPDWIVNRLDLYKGQNIVICDDDKSIHEIWRQRLAPFKSLVQITNIHSVQGFEAYLQQNLEGVPKPEEYCFLVDHEFMYENVDGLYIIQKYSLQKASLLVTSKDDDARILEKCHQLGVRLLPKDWAPIVEIGGEVGSPQKEYISGPHSLSTETRLL